MTTGAMKRDTLITQDEPLHRAAVEHLITLALENYVLFGDLKNLPTFEQVAAMIRDKAVMKDEVAVAVTGVVRPGAPAAPAAKLVADERTLEAVHDKMQELSAERDRAVEVLALERLSMKDRQDRLTAEIEGLKQKYDNLDNAWKSAVKNLDVARAQLAKVKEAVK